MKVVDANVLLYAVDEAAEHHATSLAWLDGKLSGTETVGFTWLVGLAFLRLSTKIGVYDHALSVAEALEQLRLWLANPNAVILEPTERHLDVLAGLLLEAGTGGNLTSDAHLAALAVEHGGEVVSWDNDFARFPGVRWSRPSA